MEPGNTGVPSVRHPPSAVGFPQYSFRSTGSYHLRSIAGSDPFTLLNIRQSKTAARWPVRRLVNNGSASENYFLAAFLAAGAAAAGAAAAFLAAPFLAAGAASAAGAGSWLPLSSAMMATTT